jgi:CRP-like cAMP-binding protein
LGEYVQSGLEGEMVERFKRELEEHGTLLITGVFALLNVVFGLVVYDYSRETGEIKDRLKDYDSRVARIEQTAGERGERIRALEAASTGLSHDLDRIGHDIESLNRKLDRLIEQSMRSPNPHASFSPL